MQNTAQQSNADTLERVIKLPLQYFDVTLNDQDNGGRQPGLILTKEDILTLKRYERNSLYLPTTLSQVENRLGFKVSGINGVEPIDLLTTYQRIYNHAKTWSGIENQIKLTGAAVDAFADSFTKTGETLLSIIDKMDIIDQIDTAISDLTIEGIANINAAPLSDKDKIITQNLSDFLKETAANIDLHQTASGELTEKLTAFSDTISHQLIPDVNEKVELSSRSNLEAKIAELEKEISQLTIDIDQKQKEYSQAKKNIAWGGFGGAVGLAITGGIFGKQAEKARKEKNKLVTQKNAKVAELDVKRPLAAAIRSLQTQFEDMHIRLQDALDSSTHMRDLWAMLGLYVKNSAEALANIEDNKSLLYFTLQFKSVITPWKTIKGLSSQMLELFDSALEQFRLEQNR